MKLALVTETYPPEVNGVAMTLSRLVSGLRAGGNEVEVVRHIEAAGFVAKRRTMHYDILGDPIFRERNVPRMLELAVARSDGRGGEAADLTSYEARSTAARRARAGVPPATV